MVNTFFVKKIKKLDNNQKKTDSKDLKTKEKLFQIMYG